MNTNVPDVGFAPVELLQVAGDLVDWVDGRFTYLALSRTAISVHVDAQADAEHLARLLCLGDVTDYPPEDHARGFTVWSSPAGATPAFAVCCAADLTRPVRSFPAVEPWWDDLDGSAGTEAA
ncbi:hypothetical protein ATJ88_3293 [Isoptericola jiangsuensis]|uniref:Uncharacterized protein n=1 Tax=Isoptericola jiangsuensis TaxID=548579 RepID=A0A2A9F283_9MICO|nr:hypothetical protein [Isoptericola jiangsuensis]PFG44565.1 hypothetical protein ATJ88_3293 [Isoptericola jiangsuensis]